MSLAESGAYIRLLCHSWKKGSIPNDAERCARLVGATSEEMAPLWASLKRCFIEHPSDATRLVNRRQEETRAQQIAYKRAQSENGKKGAAARGKRSVATSGATSETEAVPLAVPLATPIASVKPNVSSSSSTSSSSSIELETSVSSLAVPSRQREPTVLKLPDPTEQRARDILALLWPKVQTVVGRGMTRTQWGQRNKAAARDLAALGRTDDEILIAFASASERLGQAPYMLKIIQDELVKLALPPRKKPGGTTDMTLVPTTVATYESRDTGI